MLHVNNELIGLEAQDIISLHETRFVQVLLPQTI